MSNIINYSTLMCVICILFGFLIGYGLCDISHDNPEINVSTGTCNQNTNVCNMNNWQLPNNSDSFNRNISGMYDQYKWNWNYNNITNNSTFNNSIYNETFNWSHIIWYDAQSNTTGFLNQSGYYYNNETPAPDIGKVMQQQLHQCVVNRNNMNNLSINYSGSC